MPTFAADDNGNSAKYYIEITLSANDGNGFQQMVDFDPSSYSSSIFATNLQNVNFQDGAGNLLYSWQETHLPTSSSTSVIYWVKLPNATTTTIYMVLVATSSSSYSTTHTGVEPTYSSTYGQYDNGSSMFANYWNFSGTSLPAAFTSVVGSDGTVTVNNGLAIKLSAGQWGTYVISKSTYAAPLVLDAYLNTSSAPTAGTYALSSMILTGTSNISSASYAGTIYDDSGTSVAEFASNYENGGATFPWATFGATYSTDTNYHVYTLGMTSAGDIGFTGYNYAIDSTGSTAHAITSPYIAFQTTEYTQNVQWARTRTYPSGGSMPTQSFGSSTPINPPASGTLGSGLYLGDVYL